MKLAEAKKTITNKPLNTSLLQRILGAIRRICSLPVSFATAAVLLRNELEMKMFAAQFLRTLRYATFLDRREKFFIAPQKKN